MALLAEDCGGVDAQPGGAGSVHKDDAAILVKHIDRCRDTVEVLERIG